MFGIDSAELLIIAVVALVVIGPKDLPRVMRALGGFIGRARGMARHFRSGLDTMIREAEFEDMEKKWKAENERIMREHPLIPGDSDWGKSATGTADASRPQPPPAPPQAALPSGSSPTIPPPPPAPPSDRSPTIPPPRAAVPGGGAPPIPPPRPPAGDPK